MAIDKALLDTQFGPLLKRAFNGEAFDESALECALPEPGGDPHFDIDDKYGTWTNEGKPELLCTQCGQTFATAKESSYICARYMVSTSTMGIWDLAILAAKRAVQELCNNASDKELFLNAKARLYKKHGERAKELHTQLCSKSLLAYISRFKSLH